MSKFLHGVHDEGAEHLHADKPGWVVISEAIDHDANARGGREYRHLVDRGFTPIVRLNNAHNGVDGTIPRAMHYADFAKRCANFVGDSIGISHVIIGNEPNHLQERPNGIAITPAMYADCFVQCYDAIKAVAPNVQVITAPVAPWDATTTHIGNENGDWIVYFRTMLNAIERCDGIGLHTYTHGAGIHLITSSARMQPPFQHRRYEFRAYLDFLEAVPEDKRALPVFITETDQVAPWVDANTQWVQAAYAEINGHNQTPGTQKIRCLCLYRWQGDKWQFATKNGVQADFRAAVAKGYTSPQKDNAPVDTLLPFVPNESSSVPALPPRQWDERLTQRGVTIETPQVAPGQAFWRVVAARWYDEQESQGRYHIYVEARDQGGKLKIGLPFKVSWPSGSTSEFTKGGRGFDAGNYPMSKSLNEFSVRMNDGMPSETLAGIGMGANGNSGIHTSTGVVFQLVTMPAATSPGPTPLPTGPHATVTSLLGANIRTGPGTNYSIRGAEPQGTILTVTGRNEAADWYRVETEAIGGWVSATVVSVRNTVNVPVVAAEPVEPAPSVPQPNDNWARCIAYVRRWEGGWADDPNDSGGATNKGITIGTYTRWREAHGQQAPTKAELRNISDAEANQIYFEWYWLASGADKMAWPLCLAHFDTAVNAGTGRAQEMLSKSGGVFIAYMGHLLSWYTRIDGFEHFGRAWIRRRAEILLEAAK